MSKLVIYSTMNMVLGYEVFDIGDIKFDPIEAEALICDRFSSQAREDCWLSGLLLVDSLPESKHYETIKVRSYKDKFDEYVKSSELIYFDSTKYKYFNELKAMAYFLHDSDFTINLINTRVYGIIVPKHISNKEQFSEFIRNNIALYIACVRGLFNVGAIKDLTDCLSYDGTIFIQSEDVMDSLNDRFSVMIDNMFRLTRHSI